ncbi:MAG: hypothetical protein KF778_14415 [Rhodocyclaceae bacterium]|nr:hypothetical protein [Rhodocyclaceae bacterium]MBX3669590.1 hypothetical protein [Rhodocyclaceae bacterium]
MEKVVTSLQHDGSRRARHQGCHEQHRHSGQDNPEFLEHLCLLAIEKTYLPSGRLEIPRTRCKAKEGPFPSMQVAGNCQPRDFPQPASARHTSKPRATHLTRCFE